jgi:hydrogenase maturation protease
MKTIVIGLGNPLLGDDGIGWVVANQFQSSLERRSPGCQVEVDCLSLGGLSLMERLLGFDRAVIIDAMTTAQAPAGSVLVFNLDDLPDRTAGHVASAHDTSLQHALRLGKSMGAHLPSDVWIVGVEAQRVFDFSEELTPAVAEAAPSAVEQVYALISRSQTV